MTVSPSLAEVIALSEKALRMALQHIRICAPNATVEAALESVNLSAILSTASLPTITIADLNAEYCKGRNEGWDAAEAKYTRTSAASLRDEDAPLAEMVRDYSSACSSFDRGSIAIRIADRLANNGETK